MSSLRTKFKQVLTTLLALAMLLAMAPILPGGLAYADDNVGTYLSIEKSTYEYTVDPAFNITASYDNAGGSKWPWVGVFSGDLSVTSSFSDPEVYAYLDPTAKHGSHQGTQFNILGSGQYYDYSSNHSSAWTFPVGKYTVALFADDNYTSCVEVVHFEIVEAENPVVESIAIDKTKYSVGEPVMVTATSGYTGAWVGLYPHPGGDPLDNGDLKNYYYVKDTNGEAVDILHDDEIVENIDEDLKAGRYKVILFTSGYNIDTDEDDNLLMKFFWIGEYENPTWTINDDHTKMTATFTEKDDPSITASVSTTDFTTTENNATCTKAANTTYTANLAADQIGFLTVDEAPFTGEVVIESGEPLGHSWGEWETVTPATEQAEGLEKHVCSTCNAEETRAIPKLDHVHSPTLVQAVAATCETAGNEAYYVCECGKMFSDAEAEHEIDAIPVISAKGHAYGDWVYDAENKQHVKTCANDSSHKISEDCTFVDGDVVDGKRTHTCSVCGGSYTTDVNPVITTDHESYLYGSDILVTSNLNETPNSGWMAVYYKDQYKDADKYGQSLIWWYVGDGETTKNIKEITKSVNDQGIGQDYDGTGLRAGDYEAVYLDNGYVRHGEPTYFSVYYEYNAPGENDWTWAEDGSSATATFKADGVNFDEIETPTDPEIKTLTDNNTQAGENTATCTQGGTQVYTASVTVSEDAFVLKGNPESRTFTSTYTKNTTALGHSWGAWTEVTPATETEQGLETHECSRCHDTESRPIPVLSHTHQMTEHPAVAATCVAAGNTAYWVCDKGDNPCGKYFSDEEGENEIEKDSWIIPVTNEHDYGDWTFDGKDKKTHTKTCSRDASHKVTEDCTFEDTKEGDVIKHTCTVCGGSYTTSSAVLSVDKEKYDVSDPIMVTTNFSGTKAWVGLYKKGESYNPDAGGVKSIFWYYLDEQTNPVDIKKTRDENGRSGDFGPGKYKVVLFNNDSYTPEAECEFTVGSETASSIEIDETEYTMGDPIMVTATSDYSGAWVGLYDYDNSDPLDTTLLSYYMLSDSNGEPVDIWNGDIVKDKEKLVGLPAGKYKVILFTSGYDIDNDSQGRMAIRSFDLKDNTGCDHDWGKWEPDEESYKDPDATKTHTRVCKIDSSHVETKPCTFDDGVDSSDPGIKKYTCTVCGGTYEAEAETNEPVIKTDKEKYEVGEDILVTTELNGYDGTTDGGWIALYQRGAQHGTSLLWYYPACFENPKLLQSVLTPSDKNKENMGDWPATWGDELPPGAYELVYLYDNKAHIQAGDPAYFFVGVKKDTTEDPTCTEPGNRHLEYEDGTEDDFEIPELGHDPKEEWTYIAEEKAHYHACSRCDEKLDKAACTFDEGKVTKEPTVKEEGEKTYTCTVCGGTYTEAIPTLVESGVKRVYGSTRYQTAILQANELKALLKVDKFDAVIVATGENFADALSGAYLGYVKKAPILLVNKSSVNEVKEYIKNNLASGGTIYLLGGSAVVPNDVTSGLSGFTSKRLFGKDRYQTNIEILKEAGVSKEEIMICDGKDFADSLSASPAKRPIFLVNNSLNKAQRDYLDTLRTRKYYLIGGTGALPTALENDIKTNFGSTIRLGGKDRYDTSVKVAEALFNSPSKAVLAYGRNYPDGLCGGTLAAYMDAPLLLVQDASAATIKGYTSSKEVKSGIVLGGPSLIADKSARSIFGLNETDEIYVVNK